MKIVTVETVAAPIPMCYTCKVNPAGHGDYYKNSAFCHKCQPTPRSENNGTNKEATDLYLERQ